VTGPLSWTEVALGFWRMLLGRTQARSRQDLIGSNSACVHVPIDSIRCWGYLATLMNGLVVYCGIPLERVTYLRWNEATGEERAYKAPEKGQYTLPGATEFDQEDGYWHLGVRIELSPPTLFPPEWVFFPLCVTEHEGKPLVKLGVAGEPRRVNPDDPADRNALYEVIFETIKQCYDSSKKSASKSIGFVVAEGKAIRGLKGG
jgi:hypothetical protein